MAWARIIFLVVGRIMTGLLAGLGFGLDYFGGNLANLTPTDWRNIGFVAFIVFVVLTILREIDLALLQRPRISVTPLTPRDNNYACLQVHNTGGHATVTARAKVVKGFREVVLYDMYWETARDLNNDDESSVLVGEVVGRALVLHKATTSGKEQIMESDPDLLEEYQHKIVYPTMYVGKSLPKDECVIEVLITSEPSPLKPLKPQRYIIGVDHEQKHQLYFRVLPESIPDKEGSQT